MRVSELDKLFDKIPAELAFQILDLKKERDEAVAEAERWKESVDRHHEALSAVQENLAEYYHKNEELQNKLNQAEAQLRERRENGRL